MASSGIASFTVKTRSGSIARKMRQRTLQQDGWFDGPNGYGLPYSVMYLLIVSLPFLGSAFAGAFGRLIGTEGTAIVTTTSVALSFCFSVTAWYEVAMGSSCYLRIAPWICEEMFDAYWGFLFDSLTVVMLMVVTFVSSLVHIYAISYMSEDPHSPRFLCYLSIFTSLMLLLVTGDNLIQLFLGWEGVGIASYLLINFWYHRMQADKAAIKAMLVNRVGDFGLAIGIFGCFNLLQTVDFSTICASAAFAAEPTYSVLFCNQRVHAITVMGLFLFIGAVGKSAQIGLHTWLPDAMEGPTPVSALIHAATMVTAGVFLIARCSPILAYSPSALSLIAFSGAITSLFAATTGSLQHDLKRVIAYSTCSQLGYMIFACGISSYSVSVFHLINHAFFKALLFLSAGSVIHAMSDEQDMRKMGGLAFSLPFTYAMMLIGCLSLLGLPFLTGFYSKDVILELAYTSYAISGTFAFWLGIGSVFFTSYYSYRLLFLSFLAPTLAFGRAIVLSHDAPMLQAIPVIVLAFGSLAFGYFAKDMMIGLGTNYWANSLCVLPKTEHVAESELATMIELLPIGLSAVGAFVAYYVSIAQHPVIRYPACIDPTDQTYCTTVHRLYCYFNKRWFFDQLVNDFLVRSCIRFGYEVSFEALDKGAIELLGPTGISYTCRQLAKRISQLQSGFVYHYAFAMLLGLITLLFTVPGCRIGLDHRLLLAIVISFFL